MADTKISALPASTTPLTGAEVLPIVQSNATKQVSVANLTAGRAISATQLTLTTGNLIVASGQGVDFSATSGTGTSELLDDYEEGTWTPVVAGTTTAGVGTYTAQSGSYTKIGRVVTVTCDLAWSAHTGTGNTIITGLPFVNSGTISVGAVYANNMNFGTLASQLTAFVVSSDNNILFRGMINSAPRADVTLDSSVDALAVTLSYEQSAV
jgi:hypothetical protein